MGRDQEISRLKKAMRVINDPQTWPEDCWVMEFSIPPKAS